MLDIPVGHRTTLEEFLQLTDSSRILKNPKGIPTHERLIVALDLPTYAEARELVERLGDTVSFYKIGYQLFLAADGGYFEFADKLATDLGKKTMVDLKMHDVPETVARGVEQLRNIHATFATVHAQQEAMVKAAVAHKNGVKILAVTVLTSLDDEDLFEQGYSEGMTVEKLVLRRAQRAIDLGCDGVVSSGREAPVLRDAFGPGIAVVTPGIRSSEQSGTDDQKRTVDVEEAFNMGADYIVVGRPIREASDPAAKAAEIQDRISKLFDP